jgi:hypothetical protein
MINSKSNLNITRELEWFNKKGSTYLVDNESIDHLETPLLINLLALVVGNDKDLILGAYPVLDEYVYKLQPYLKHKINTEKYDYFIATYARDSR